MRSLQVKNLSKVYPNGNQALNNINFTVNPGEAVILLGHNGSGKSTLFRSMINFETPTTGEVLIGGQSTTSLSRRQLRPIRQKVGMVFQNFNLVHNLSVFQNVLFGALGTSKTIQTFNWIAPKELRFKAMEALDRVGLSEFAKRRADELSGGQQQRVAIARMLMQDPELVLADEPIASLDPKAGREVMDLLWDIVHERGLTVVSILHQMDIAKEYGERILALKDGELVIDQDIHTLNERALNDLYHQPTTKQRAGA
ncbi:phosphonate transport system ATP-binding protein [Salsuginibacillus halophilus]|uniref:Phosphonate transport system ATP-binding protein n=1 Tax=Salsuginibacillus halophilus TaxID=517424 RepID=A0A2P8H877_9BACI|nr:phosphonate ABC transporter ATP-binding protein [Salsuginibacillus halophilus]PSL42401.1 phosphonate transport system ATP-binding protein [Salsuginibacillus halophilus]